jgi:hypothetical protein
MCPECAQPAVRNLPHRPPRPATDQATSINALSLLTVFQFRAVTLTFKCCSTNVPTLGAARNSRNLPNLRGLLRSGLEGP